jgi:hypothetical protein
MTGDVMWVGNCKFSGKLKVGIRDLQGEVHFTAASNVEVMPTSEELSELVRLGA